VRRSQLRLLILEAHRLTSADEVLIIGSQSVLATWGEEELPEEVTLSAEADMLVRVRNGIRLSDEEADYVSQFLERSGQLSEFDAEHGVHIDSVSANTAVLPQGWEQRLVPFEVRTDDDELVVGMCLDPYDVCASKAIANRPHDRDFIAALIRSGFIDPNKLQSRLELYTGDADINHAFVFVQGFFAN
jgi:hypothetical protein